jgi:hypothetical protein
MIFSRNNLSMMVIIFRPGFEGVQTVLQIRAPKNWGLIFFCLSPSVKILVK